MIERVSERPAARWKVGVLAFLICLLLMPVGHALMVLNEQVLHAGKFISACCIGVLGVAVLLWGIGRRMGDAHKSLCGLLAGILVWTGLVEFSFVWIAEKLSVPHLTENGEVVTKAEYLVMLSSAGLLASVILMFMLGPTRCQFFRWCQRTFGIRRAIRQAVPEVPPRPLAVTVFMETIVIIWAFYILLLLAYDPHIAGNRHPFTYIVAFGSLVWSSFLFAKLMRIKAFDHALRYAIPTVIIFWNFVDVAGRWNLFAEVWVDARRSLAGEHHHHHHPGVDRGILRRRPPQGIRVETEGTRRECGSSAQPSHVDDRMVVGGIGLP